VGWKDTFEFRVIWRLTDRTILNSRPAIPPSGTFS
jgi:hypothetical protein